jgi:hypothetical protein
MEFVELVTVANTLYMLTVLETMHYYYYYYSSISACSPRAGTDNIHVCAPLSGNQSRGNDCKKTKRE